MKVSQIISLGAGEKGAKDSAYSHFFEVRIKSGFLSHQDASLRVLANRPEIHLDEVVNAIESQEKHIMREVLDILRSKNAFALISGKCAFTTKIGDDDCKFDFMTYMVTANLI